MQFKGNLIIVCILILAGMIPEMATGQVTVVEGTAISLTPQQFVETFLAGEGITILNALYNGSAEPLNSTNRTPLKYRDQIGSFESAGGAATELGISGGVILSTGYSGKAVAGLNPNDDMQGNNQPTESDPDLVILAGGTTQINDKSVLEFDFIPQTDYVTFRYVFGSIEFDGFCASINDAFGLFLSGPGISGGLGFVNDAVNIALLPNSTNYVNIFNICAADQGNLGQGIYSWWNAKEDYYSYNRLTYVFTATYPVLCNQTYHMKFAIGDASDGILDSGVFLEENSFTSNNITGNTSFSNPYTGQLLVEGCNNVEISYSIPQAQLNNVVIDMAIHASGTAIQADILPNPFPVHVNIPAGQLTSPAINISALADALTEGPETLVIKATTTNSCGLANTVTTELTILDYTPPVVSLNNAVICDGSSVTLSPVISGGQPKVPENIFFYLWSTGDTTPSITVSPPFGLHPYGVTITDACSTSVIKDITVSVGTTPEPAGPITGDATICTPVSGLIYSIDPIPGADIYEWSLPPGGTIVSGANTAQITVDFDVTTPPGNITVRGVSTVCGTGALSVLPIALNPSAPAAGPVTGMTTLCQSNQTVSYSIDPLSFVNSYTWTVPPGVTIISGENTPQISCLFGTSAVSGNVTVKGWNADCGFGPASTIAVTVNPIPANAGSITSSAGNTICIPASQVTMSILPVSHATGYQWNYTGDNTTLVSNGNQAILDFPVNATSGSLQVVPMNGCGNGDPSPPLEIILHPSPVVDFPAPLLEMQTTRNGRPVLLRGALPAGPGGIFSGPGVSEIFPGTFVFNPEDNSVTPGGPGNGIPHVVTYQYTNVYGCSDQTSFTIRVFGSNGLNPCPGTVRDVRDNTIYQTFSAGTGPGARCWMAENLNAGTYIPVGQEQTDNHIREKFCPQNQSSKCNHYGGFYQWDEMMLHTGAPGYQDICPPGWHVPSASEWQFLIDFYQGNAAAGNFMTDTTISPGFHGILNGVRYQNFFWALTGDPVQGSIYWSAEADPPLRAVARGLNLKNSSVSLYQARRSDAFFVRCVRN